MARGILGAIDSFAGGLAQGWDRQQKMDLARRADERAQAEEDRRKEEHERLKRIRDSFDIPEFAAAQGAQFFDTDPSAGQPAAPAPAGKAPDAAAAAAAAAAVKAAPAAALPAPNLNKVPQPGDIKAVDPDKALAAPAAAIPAATAAPQPAAASAAPAAPAAPRYVRAVGADGRVGWVEAGQGTRRPDADLMRARASAVSSLDPVLGNQLLVSANTLEGQNIELSSKRYEQGVLQAMQVAQADPVKGLDALTSVYKRLMPDLREPKFEVAKDGSIKVTYMASTAAGDIPVGSEIVPSKGGKPDVEKVFRTAMSYSSPEAFRQRIIDDSTLATQELSRMVARAQESRASELFPYQKQVAALQPALVRSNINQNNASANAANASAETNRWQATEFGAPVPGASGGFGEAIEDAALQAIPGIQVTSRTRSAERNKAVGGEANSYHLTGEARDFVPPKGMSLTELGDKLKQVYGPDYDVIYNTKGHYDHVHVEPGPRLAASAGGRAGGIPTSPRNIRAAQSSLEKQVSDELKRRDIGPSDPDYATARADIVDSILNNNPQLKAALVPNAGRAIADPARQSAAGKPAPAPANQGKAPPKQAALPEVYDNTWTGDVSRWWSKNRADARTQWNARNQAAYNKEYAARVQQLQAEIKAGKVNRSTLMSVAPAYRSSQFRQFLPPEVANLLNRTL